MKNKILIIVIIILSFIVGFQLSIILDNANKVNPTLNDVDYLEKIEGLNIEIDFPVEEKKVNYMYGEATAYHPWSGGINTDGNPDVTSTGRKSEEGIIAVDFNTIPYGSEVMIISGKTVVRGVADDTGGFRFSNSKQVDILMECPERAKEWGRREAHIIWW